MEIELVFTSSFFSLIFLLEYKYEIGDIVIDDLLKLQVLDTKFLSEEEKENMDFFTLALYLQELNKYNELCKFELEDEVSE